MYYIKCTTILERFHYVSSYLQTKVFARKRDFAVSLKRKYQDLNKGHFIKLLQMPSKTTALRQPIHFSRAVQF